MRGKYVRNVLVGMVILALLCGGCRRKRVNVDEAQLLRAEGRAAFEEWLSENMSGAEILTAENVIDRYPGGGSACLTDYICGEFRTVDGQEQFYWFDTFSGKAYLSGPMEELRECAAAYAAECLLRLIGENTVLPGRKPADKTPGKPGRINMTSLESAPRIDLLLPTAPEGSSREVLHDTMEAGVFPAEITDVEAFVRDPENRDRLSVRMSVRVPDEIQLHALDAEKLLMIRKRYGLVFNDLTISNTSETAEEYWDEVTYRKTETADFGKFRLEAETVSRTERIDEEKGRASGNETRCDPRTDLTITETEDGMTVSYPDPDHVFSFYLYTEDPAVAGDRYEWVIEEDWTEPVFWKETPEGFRLTQENEVPVKIFKDCLLRKIPPQ